MGGLNVFYWGDNPVLFTLWTNQTQVSQPTFLTEFCLLEVSDALMKTKNQVKPQEFQADSCVHFFSGFSGVIRSARD